MTATLRLKVRKIQQICLFELVWGEGQQLETEIVYPPELDRLYLDWRRAYLNFYRQLDDAPPPTSTPIGDGMRGRLAQSSTSESSEIDWRSTLAQAETKWLNAFYSWLQSGELYPLRRAIAQAGQNRAEAASSVTVFLTCASLDLARLPWESWEIGADMAVTRRSILIVRVPPKISLSTSSQQRRRARILVILGDETGLDFQADRRAVQSLSPVAEVQFRGWQRGKDLNRVKAEILEAIADEEGWDVLLFAGHSNETRITGGELAIAPQTSIGIQEIAPQIRIAQERGLQFALFNSCSGLNIAESLIDLGLSQVVVMREPIHNRVAQEFLIDFLQCLGQHYNVQDALEQTCQRLELSKRLTYPSAALVPSLFCHPGATPFRIPPSGWKYRLKSVLPNRWEAIALSVCVVLGTWTPMQQWMLQQRLWVQSIYRNQTGQLPAKKPPPVTLIHIDEESIEKADPSILDKDDLNPLDRRYLAAIVDRLRERNARVIGIDYLLDYELPGKDLFLSRAVQQSIERQTWFIFATLLDNATGQEKDQIHPNLRLNSNWKLQGYANSAFGHLELLYPGEDCRQLCPFAYLLSLVAKSQSLTPPPPQPQLQNQSDLRTQLLDFLQSSPQPTEVQSLTNLRHYPVSDWAYQFLPLQVNTWLTPILDFSLPPTHAYHRVSAWRLLDKRQSSHLSDLSQQVVIVAAGGYGDAGLAGENDGDAVPLPPALRYWTDQMLDQQDGNTSPLSLSAPLLTVLTGGEQLAYGVHHLLTRHVVVQVPDLWLIALAGATGKGISVAVTNLQRRQQWTRQRRSLLVGGLSMAIAAYALTSLQLYISAGVLLPWLLPSVTLGVYVLRVARKKTIA